ncbi:MAG: hypothetical protein OXI20_17245 [Rhodospirillales bacterium]|nr:hypothetical protein [Rhodospirillales bacterium]
MLDDLVLARNTGASVLRRPVPVALSTWAYGKKEIVHCGDAASESAVKWRLLFADHYRRRLRQDGLTNICANCVQDLTPGECCLNYILRSL